MSAEVANAQRRWKLWGIHVSALLLMLMIVILLHNPLMIVLYLIWVGVFVLHTRWLVHANAERSNIDNLDE